MGENRNYYLFDGVAMRTMSSNGQWPDKHVNILRILESGEIYGTGVSNEKGGVQSFTKKETFLFLNVSI